MLLKMLYSALFCITTIYAYEIPDENEILSRTCRITVKVQVLPDKQMQRSTGRAVVTATLTDDEQNPYRQERVSFSANAGTFACKLAKDTAAAPDNNPEHCFVTGFDGNAKVYLVNIPLNTPIRITASYACDDRTVSSYATMSVSRGKVKKKKQVVPH